MKTRIFGKTGLAMPVLSCGLMRSMYSWKDMESNRIPVIRQQDLGAVVDAALKNGLNHLETARGYGSSERQLAPILAKYDRDSFILQTKVAPEDDPAKFIANVEDSMARMGQQRLDLLALHGINDHRSLWQVCRPGGCLAAARGLQEQGRVGWIGFSGHGDVEIILEAVNHLGDGGFDYINLHWYTIFQRNSQALEAAAERNLGVFIISPTDKGGMLQKPPEKLTAACAPLTPIQFNDLYCLQRPEIHTISVGASCPAEFTDHLAILPLLEDRDPVAAIYQKWQQLMENCCGSSRPDALWQQLPLWYKTPGYMNIGYILWLYNIARGWDLLEYARNRYQLLGVQLAWVPGTDAAAAGRYNLNEISSSVGMSGEKLTEMLQDAHELLKKQSTG